MAQQVPLKSALERTASSSALAGTDGSSQPVAVRTLEDWWYAHQRGGFAALHPKTRSDRGVPRKLTPELEQLIVAQVKAQPAIPIKVLYRQWKQAHPTLPSVYSIYASLRRHDLSQRSRHYLIRQAIGGPTKAFEVPLVNELWMVDFSPGPFLHPAGQKKATPTHLCALLDDHSRVVPHAAYYPKADTRCFHCSLKEAIRRRGVPRKLYTDQGGPFINDHTRVICANLSIRLLHAKPYHAWSKGKIERFFYTVQRDFEASLRLPGQQAASLEELNARLADWLQTVYHVRRHEGIDMSPQERFARGSAQARPLDRHLDLERLFYAQELRRVRKDGTVRLNNDLYEVDLALRGLEVRLRFDPWSMARVEVDYRGQSFGLARKVDRHLNSQLQGVLTYEK
ncbi:MAG TPA: DDE-type integrase/transposase/recombinase [Candidatus Angelobacter sp.]|nr:DDE-type integrase/transposase/recombinase [Candidatus Angelobacter sp.]